MINYRVYGHKNRTTSKWYIGQTARDLGERPGTDDWNYLKIGRGHFKHPKFVSAINGRYEKAGGFHLMKLQEEAK